MVVAASMSAQAYVPGGESRTLPRAILPGRWGRACARKPLEAGGPGTVSRRSPPRRTRRSGRRMIHGAARPEDQKWESTACFGLQPKDGLRPMTVGEVRGRWPCCRRMVSCLRRAGRAVEDLRSRLELACGWFVMLSELRVLRRRLCACGSQCGYGVLAQEASGSSRSRALSGARPRLSSQGASGSRAASSGSGRACRGPRSECRGSRTAPW